MLPEAKIAKEMQARYGAQRQPPRPAANAQAVAAPALNRVSEPTQA